MQITITKIESGLRELVESTKIGNENLIKRSKILIEMEKLITDLKHHTQRRLTGKLQPNPSAQIDLIFQKFYSLTEGALRQ